MALGAALKPFIHTALDAVLPPRCAVTGDLVDRQGMVSPRGWAALNFIAAPMCACCGLPFNFGAAGDKALCAGCLSEPPNFAMARAALRYDDGSKAVVLAFKHADKTHYVSSCVPWLLKAGAEVLDGADLLLPVPLHRRRLLARRYNQALLLASGVAVQTGIALLPDTLIRTRHTESQGRKKRKEREKNIRGAFAVREDDREQIKDRVAVLIDDVDTTGATLNECAAVLRKAGAAEVRALTVARACGQAS